MHDTTAAARQVQAEAIRRLDPVQRLRQALELSESVRALELARLRTLHAGRTDVELVELLINTTLIPARFAGPAAWAKLGGSARQLEDVAALLRVQTERLDRAYLERWIADLGLAAQWEQVLREARA
jgi:hypothetical protein